MTCLLIAITSLTLGAAQVDAPVLTLKPMESGALKAIGAVRPFSLNLSDKKPASLTKIPEMKSPRFGTIKIGTREFMAALDGDDKLYVDSNQDGDLTDDPATEWAGKDGQPDIRNGFATVDLPIDGKVLPCRVGVYKNESFYGYFIDFALAGTLTVRGKSYNAIYSDESATWDGTQGMLCIDEKGDGKIGPQQLHRVGDPFMLDGRKYELGAAQGHPTLLNSTKPIVPRPVRLQDPNSSNGLKIGSSVLPFESITTDGKSVSFPGSFKGKIVLLDFWATWCSPCMAEVPNVVKAYEAYHDKGFEILGISLDRVGALSKVRNVTAQQKMTWPQVYDGKYFEAAVAKRYGIQAIPEAYLVDGDTGKILAFGSAIRGEGLARAIEKALKAVSHANQKLDLREQARQGQAVGH